jgi:uncharacterized protein YndB with AHSA1/START domain
METEMRVEADITVRRPRGDVFDYLAEAEHLPEYVTEFAWVRPTSAQAPARGSEYRYEMVRGQTTGTFEWVEFERPSKLAWHGPPAKTGPGSMEPLGWWELSGDGQQTDIKFVMAPKPGGLFKLIAPFMARSMRKGSAQALQRLKQQLETGAQTERSRTT